MCLSIGKIRWGEVTTEMIEDSEYFVNKCLVEPTWL